MWLDIGIVGAEQLFGAFDGERFDVVDELAATVVTFARVTLGILVRQHAALRGHDPLAGVIFGGDQLDMFFLAALLGVDRFFELGIIGGNSG